MTINKRVWLNKHGELTFSEDQGVCVKVFWESKHRNHYINASCNGETMGIDKVYEKVSNSLFSICEYTEATCNK